MNKPRFNEFDLSPETLRAIEEMGFEEASPIQAETIPPLLKGNDVIGQAQTGTGKTAAFAIPAIESIDCASRSLQVLVLCPTRELVIQVTEEFRKLMKYQHQMNVVPVYGGQEIDRQLKALKKGTQVIIGTPGRMMDHMRRGSVDLSSVRIVVLDEADEMLDMGFRDDIEVILQDTPPTRQTVMFSATMPEEILRLMKRYQNNPVKIDVTYHRVNAPRIDQYYFDIQEKTKPEALARLIDINGIKLSLVFCNTKNQVDLLVEILKSRGYSAEALHGGLNQKQRDKVMNGFRNGKTEILVATDVAGRGIDVTGIEAVFNYDLPRDDEDYIHRIGRTARAGRSGKAFTFIVGKQIHHLRRIERINGITVARSRIPSMEDMDESNVQAISSMVTSAASKGIEQKYQTMVERIMGDDFSSLDIAATLLKIFIDSRSNGLDKTASFDNERSDVKNNKMKKSGKDERFGKGKGSGKRKGPFTAKKEGKGKAKFIKRRAKKKS